MTQFKNDLDDDSRPLRDLLAVYGQGCADCGVRCSAHDVVRSIILGFKDTPRCLLCLSRGLVRDPGELCEQLVDYVRRRECFRRAWAEADRLEATPPVGAIAEPRPVTNPAPVGGAGAVWDAGSMACGELVLALRVRLNSLPPRAVLRLRATDPAAPEDIPAWCRLTGHTLLSAAHPEYHIRRREE